MSRHQPERRPRRIDVRPARDVLLEHVVLHRAGERGARDALLLADHDVHRQQDRRGGVDRHRGRDPVERDLAEEVGQVVDRVDRDPDPSHLALRHRMVGVVAHLRRQIERGRQAHLPRGQELPEPAVGLLRRAEPGVLAHGPEPAGVHVGVDAAGERKFAGPAEVARRIAGPVAGAVDRRGHRAGCETAPLTRAELLTRRIVSATKPTSSRLPMTSGVR